jgi:hypothetical protein
MLLRPSRRLRLVDSSTCSCVCPGDSLYDPRCPAALVYDERVSKVSERLKIEAALGFGHSAVCGMVI